MKITELHVHPITPYNGLVAFANLVLDNALFIGSIAIHRKLDGTGYRITYPKKGKGYLFHPICKPLSKTLEQAIINEVKVVLGNANAGHHRLVPQPN
jgi:stage V sporulation protein G